LAATLGHDPRPALSESDVHPLYEAAIIIFTLEGKRIEILS
jgi:hypothetical protein